MNKQIEKNLIQAKDNDAAIINTFIELANDERCENISNEFQI